VYGAPVFGAIFAPRMLRVLGILLLFSLPFGLAGQPGLLIQRTLKPVQIDARMDEADWQNAQVVTNFMQYFPYDTSLANGQTEVRMMYDDDNIYLFAKMYNVGPRTYVTPSLRRDFRGEANDGLTIVFDPFQDRTNGFVFGTNPYGVQREGLIANGGGTGRDFSLDWDNKWYSESAIHPEYWVTEMAIPFKTLRFKEGLDKWYINFYRIDSENAERSTWSPIPRNFDIVNMAFNRELIWDKPLRTPGSNISLIPYLAGGQAQDFARGTPPSQTRGIGADAKVAIGPALNLDLTVNPDFSQVEVDQQVTNLDRFEIFFPERRQFFLENADLFASFGVEGTRPFFSRRIGLVRDESIGQNIQNPIPFGARLSGKITNNTRVGFLNMQAGRDVSIGLPSTNFTVATLQQKVFARSNFGLMVVNKQAFQDSLGGDFTLSPKKFDRVLGFDYNLASKNNRWNGKFFYHREFNEKRLDSTFATGGFLNYGSVNWQVDVFVRNVGANYNPAAGFVRRTDFVQGAATVWRNFYPARGRVQSHGPGFDFDLLGNQRYTSIRTDLDLGRLEIKLLDWDANLMYRIRWRSTANFTMRLRTEYTYLFFPFDPSGTQGRRLAAGTDYRVPLVVASYVSDARKRFFFNVATRSGGYFNGTRLSLSGAVNYRYQPYGFASLDFTFNRIQLPEPYNDANLFLIGPRFDFTFSRSVFWTTFFQYNSQIANLNINSRFQWRFKPVSDLFIVYTDNYLAESFSNGQMFFVGPPRNRAIVLKLTYWLNI
jgi:hypothetical protein